MSEQKEMEEEPAVEIEQQVDGAVNTEVDPDGRPTDPVHNHKQEEDHECGVNGQTIFPRSGQGWEEAVSQTNIYPQDSEGGHSPKKTSSAYVGNSTATVKIILVPEGQVMTMAFAIGLSIEELKSHFAEELKVPAEVLHVSWNSNVVEDHMTLMDLGVQPNGTTQLELSSTDPLNHPVRPAKPQQDYNMPDVITVRVQQDAELSEFQEVVVEIERATQRKAFLGGYRHTVTGAEYHHAAVQTPAKRRPDRGVAVFSRDTQTVLVKSQAQQYSHSVSTQMTGIGCYVSCMKDKLLTPTGTYVTAAQLHSHRLDAVVTLQTYVRRWLARCCVEELRRARDRRLAWIDMEQRRREEEVEERARAEDRRRRNPRRKEDFALLYNALEKWRQEELQLINSSLCGAERKAALCSLLEQETQLISSIGRHRLLAQQNNYDKAVHAFLDKCAAPRRWCALDGQMTNMDTPSTLRAKELRDLYTSLALTSRSQEERLDALLSLKHTVKEHDCKLTRDMVELIDREADLTMRGVKRSSLEGLRKRISTLFLQYIKTPTFNPEVARWLKVPQEDPSGLHPKEKKRYYCHGCRRYLPSGHFSLTATARRVAAGQCRQCGELDNEARQRQDFSKYHAVLERLRRDEESLSTDTSITYLLQEKDMHHLVDVVWGCQSALCACRDLHELLMVRWERRRHWSPWNCILLTKDEAAAHRQVDRVSQAYGLALVQSVEHKHTVAKRYFAQIPAMARYLRNVESQPVARGNQLVSKPITTETD